MCRRAASSTSIGLFFLSVLAGFIYARLAKTYHLQIPPLIWFYAGLAIGLAFHEAGHALCAVVSGKPMRLVSIGVGPLLLSGRLGETKIEWRLLPFSGLVQCYPDLVPRQLPTILFVLGGVIGNAILIAIIVVLDFTSTTSLKGRAALTAIIIAQLLFIATNLFPYRMRIGATKVGSDGLQLLRLFLPSRNDAKKAGEIYTAMLKRYSSTGDVQSIEAPHSARIFYQIYRPDRWADEGTRREVHDALMRELDNGYLGRQEEMLVLDALLTYGLVCDDPKLRDRLDDWSLRALELGPEIPTLVSTRGGVLVTLGRYEEGRALLTALPRTEDNGPFDDAAFDTLMNQVFLARAEHALGDSATANTLIAAARAAAKKITDWPAVPLLIARFEHELNSMSPTS